MRVLFRHVLDIGLMALLDTLLTTIMAAVIAYFVFTFPFVYVGAKFAA
jgi:hypothetical protein